MKKVKKLLTYEAEARKQWSIADQQQSNSPDCPAAQLAEERALSLFREMTEEERQALPEHTRKEYANFDFEQALIDKYSLD